MVDYGGGYVREGIFFELGGFLVQIYGNYWKWFIIMGVIQEKDL